MNEAGRVLLKTVMERLGLSARAYDRILKVARKISSRSCKKGLLDYTKKYTENFGFTTEYHYFNSLTGVIFDTTYIYNGTIKKIKRGEIKIKFGDREDDFFDVEINKESEFSRGYLIGSFSDQNNVKISYSTGGLGGGGRYYITGVRNY